MPLEYGRNGFRVPLESLSAGEPHRSPIFMPKRSNLRWWGYRWGYKVGLHFEKTGVTHLGYSGG